MKKFDKGDKVVNRIPKCIDKIHTVSYTNGHAIWLEGESVHHGFVPDNFDLATEEELKSGHRLFCI